MPQLVLLGANPSKRRKSSKKHSTKRRAKRHASAARTGSVIVVRQAHRNPSKRRSSTAAKNFSRKVRRSFRRNPIGMPRGMKGFVGEAMHQAVNGVVGGVGAIGVDLLMGQVAKALPASMNTKYTATDGSFNYGYLGVKTALALAAGLAGRFLPAKVRPYLARMSEGSITVMSYDVIRTKLPDNLATLGYVCPSQTLSGPANVRSLRLAGTGSGSSMRRSSGVGSTSPALVLG